MNLTNNWGVGGMAGWGTGMGVGTARTLANQDAAAGKWAVTSLHTPVLMGKRPVTGASPRERKEKATGLHQTQGWRGRRSPGGLAGRPTAPGGSVPRSSSGGRKSVFSPPVTQVPEGWVTGIGEAWEGISTLLLSA